MGETNASSCAGFSSWSLDAAVGVLGVCAVAIAGMSSNSNAASDRLRILKVIHASCLGRDCAATSPEAQHHIPHKFLGRRRYGSLICINLLEPERATIAPIRSSTPRGGALRVVVVGSAFGRCRPGFR